MKHLLKTSISSDTLLLFRSPGQLPASVRFISVAVSCKRKSVPACAQLFSQFLSLCCVQALQQSPSITGVSNQKSLSDSSCQGKTAGQTTSRISRPKASASISAALFQGFSKLCFTGKNNMCGLYDHFSSERMGHGFHGFPTSCYSLFLFLYRSGALLLFATIATRRRWQTENFPDRLPHTVWM